ncbi:MAG TPA: hypothetical protein VKB18_01460 [Gemmatimonadota bacterium]|nr:hypothetical protein [Gemmatimonadota bacterium]
MEIHDVQEARVVEIRRWKADVRRAGTAIVLVAAAGLVAACGGDGGTGPGGSVKSVDLNLAAGESRVVPAGANVLELNLPAASSDREYRVAVQNASTSDGTQSMRLVTGTGPGASGSVSPALSLSPSGAAGPPVDLDMGRLRRDERAELRLRANVRATLERYRPEPARLGVGGGRRASAALIGSGASAGDTLHINFPIEGQSLSVTPCDTAAPDTIAAVIRRVSNRAIFAEDVDNPDQFSSSDYDQLANEFDNYIFAVDSAYFGAPADIDGNGHVIVLFTKRVNELTPANSQTYFGGFFLPTDLARESAGSANGSQSAGYCEHSNVAELVYLVAPDPNGDVGPQFSVAEAKDNARVTSSHEFQHLLSAEDRVIKQSGTFDDLQDTWLDEGMSHIAEEIVGLVIGNHGTRQNLTFSDVTGNGTVALGDTTTQTTVFNVFLLQNFARLAQYWMAPATTQALALKDPGSIASLKMRGFAYVLLRWLGDQFGPAGSGGAVPGSDEEALFRRIASGGSGLQTGVDDILGAVSEVSGQSPSWAQLLGDFSIMADVDDIGVPLARSEQTIPTWDLRDIYSGLYNANWSGSRPDAFSQPYPLAVVAGGFTADTTSLDIRAATARYFELSGTGSVPAFTLTLTDPSGAALTASVNAQVTVVRTK